MPLADTLPGWTVPDQDDEPQIRTYSTVGDILAYQRCRRQYGYFKVRGFTSSTMTQRYFGTLVHDVLDQIYRDFRAAGRPGREGAPLPDATALERLVMQAHDRLVRSGVQAYDPPRQRRRAVRLIGRFLDLFGEAFFASVEETEFRLSRALRTDAQATDYVLEGVVDVLSGAVSHALRLPYSTEPDDVEIWDYKSGQMPDQETRELQAYKYQMRVYAELYRQQTGRYPARAVLIFLGELDDDARWEQAQGEPRRFPGLVYSVEPHPGRIDAAVRHFGATVEAIEEELDRAYRQQWLAPDEPPDEQTCRACELRYNCAAYPEGRTERAAPL